jgi:hypothetical protein
MSNRPIISSMQFEQAQISEQHQTPSMTIESKQHMNNTQEQIELSGTFDGTVFINWDIDYIHDSFVDYL